jgi:hypothetical protein
MKSGQKNTSAASRKKRNTTEVEIPDLISIEESLTFTRAILIQNVNAVNCQQELIATVLVMHAAQIT